MKPINRKYLIDISIVLLALSSAFTAIYFAQHKVHFVRLLSNSMAPTFHRGDTLLFKTIPTRKLEVGEIALLPLVDGSGSSYAHRIIKRELSKNAIVTVKTKGDGNPIPDNWKLDIKSPKVQVFMAGLPTKDLPLLHPNKWVTLTLYSFLVFAITPFLFWNPKRERKSKELVPHTEDIYE